MAISVTTSHVVVCSDLRNLNYRRPAIVEAENLFNAKNNNGFAHLYYATVSTDLDEALEAAERLMPILDSLERQGLVHSYNDMVPKLFVSQAKQQRRIEAWNAFWSDSRKAEAMTLVRREAEAAGMNPYMFADFEGLLEADYTTSSLLESDVVPPELLGNSIECNADSQYMVFTDVAMLLSDKDSVTDAVLKNPKTFVLKPFYYCKSMVEMIHDDFNVAVWISSLFVLVILLLSFRIMRQRREEGVPEGHRHRSVQHLRTRSALRQGEGREVVERSGTLIHKKESSCQGVTFRSCALNFCWRFTGNDYFCRLKQTRIDV